MEFASTHHADGLDLTVWEGDDAPAVIHRRQFTKSKLHESSHDRRRQWCVGRKPERSLGCRTTLRNASEATDHSTAEGKVGVVLLVSGQATDDDAFEGKTVDAVLAGHGRTGETCSD